MKGNENNDAEVVEDESLASEIPAAESETPTPEPETPPKAKSSKLATFIALLSLILVILVIAAAAYFYKENKSLMDQQQADVAQLSEQIKTQNNALKTQSQLTSAVESKLKTQAEKVDAQLQNTSDELQKASDTSKLYISDMKALQRALAETQVRHPNDWILAEVEYLVNLTGRKIWLEKDIPSAVALLVAADQRVVELSDASLSVLRAAILEDVNMLQALPKLDPDGLVLSLSALERRIDKLAIIGLNEPSESVEAEVAISSDINDWKENLTASWSSFVNSFIVINKRDTKLEALLSPEQRWFLKENVRHALTKAELAVYRERQDVYDEALKSALSLLNDYYDLEDSATSAFYKSVQDLGKHNVAVEYPDQLKTDPLLKRIIEQRVKKSLASSRVGQE